MKVNTLQIKNIIHILYSIRSTVNNIICFLEIKKQGDKLYFSIADDSIYCTEIYSLTDSFEDFIVYTDVFKFYNAIKNCPYEITDISFIKNQLKISCKTINFTINTFNNTNLSKYIIQEPLYKFNLKAKQLQNIINNVKICAAKSNLHPNLNSISLQCNENVLTCITIDGCRLGIESINIEVNADFNIVIPLNIALKISTFLDNILDTNISININNNYLMIQNMQKQGIFSLMKDEYKFPDYTHLIPKDNLNILKCNTNDLINVIRRITSISTENIKHIQFNLSKTNLQIFMQENSRSQYTTSSEKVDYNSQLIYEGEDLQISFNADFLTQILNQHKDKNISMSFKNSSSAVLITCNKDLKYIIMPLKTRNI